MNRRIFSSHMFLGNVFIALITLGAFIVVVALITAGVAVFRGISSSAWDIAMQLPRWYTLFVGVALIKEFLPTYLAHGQTRREFAAQATLCMAAFTPVFSLLTTLGFLLERGVYELAGWPQIVTKDRLFTAADQYPLIFAQFAMEFGVWMVAGALMAAGIYRSEGGGLVTIPLGIALIIPVELVLNGRVRLPFLSNLLDIRVVPSLGTASGVSAGLVLLGLLLTWGFVRDMPLRNQAA